MTRSGCICIEFGHSDYLHVVQVGVKVGKQNGDLASGGEKVSDLGHGDEISDMWLAYRMARFSELHSSQDFKQIPPDLVIKSGHSGLACCRRSPVNLEVAGLHDLVYAVFAEAFLKGCIKAYFP